MTLNGKTTIRKPVFLAAGVVLWAGIIGTGVFVLGLHAATPGIGAIPDGGRTDAAGDVATQLDKLTLVMFLHPKCPCSTASLAELASLMERDAGRVHARVVMFQPRNQSDDWSQTAMWSAAARIPGVSVETDYDATLAKRLDARTSGQVFLFDTNGRLKFAGGITGARGHVGRNDSFDALARLVETESTTFSSDAVTHKPVFGCEIYEIADREVRSE